MALLEIRNLSFSYGAREIFRDISLTLEKGAVSCLLGPNGCGKTTLLDSVPGFHRPASGEILLDGKNAASLNPAESAKLAAYVPQHHEKHFPYTVFDVILMGRTAHLGFFDSPGREDRLKVARILEKSGLSHLAERDYRELSGGETKMILILRALVQDSPLVIMDEPTSHLDFRNELLLMEKIISLVKEERRAVLMSTHSLNQTFLLAGRGVPVQIHLMGEPGMFLSGAPEQVLTEENMEKFYGIRAARMPALVPQEIVK